MELMSNYWSVLLQIMQITSSVSDGSQAYMLKFFGLRFLFLSQLNLKNLQYFCQSNQDRMGKIDIRFNLDFLKQLPQNNHADYIVLTEYQQILAVPFLLRNQSQQVKILTTKSIAQSAKIYATDFHAHIKKIDQITKKLSFNEQSQIIDNYEITFNRDFSSWPVLYKKSELIDAFEKVIGINYAERLNTQRGVQITPYPSGISIGSACWLFQNLMNKQNILWVQGLSHHQWRACREFSLGLSSMKIDHIVFSAGSLSNINNPSYDQVQCEEFLKMIFQRLNMSKGHNSKIILNDFLVICDIINYIVLQFNQKFKQIFFTGVSISKMICYADSLVEYLSPHHCKRIYEDPPVYPFQTFTDIKGKKIREGVLEEISEGEKIPLKELILRSTPFLCFQADFYAYLHEQYDSVVCEKIFQHRLNIQILKSWITNSHFKNIVYFSDYPQEMNKIRNYIPHLQCVPLGQTWRFLETPKNKFYTAEGQLSGLLGKYKKKNGWLYLQPFGKEIRVLKSNWTQQFCGGLSKAGILNKSEDGTIVETANSQIRLQEYSLRIKTKSEEELLLIQKLLEKTTSIFRIK